ncbi:MAG: DUF4250 domain-containing protein [Muribaculaceae bacterium]|nr:DUF4250 domain-containing protein [Muribaculaceae bacterium]
MLRTLPQDPVILLSFVNTRLRDNYESLDLLCDDLDVNKDDIVTRLASIGYIYDVKQNKFV